MRAAALASGLVLVAVGSATGCGAGGAASPAPAPPTSARPSLPAGTAKATPQQLVAAARWSRTRRGARLHVRPTGHGRLAAAAAPRQALAQALRLGGQPPVALDRTSRHALLDQLRCHATYAGLKPMWNLETWRPDVGYAATVRALCNPS